MGIRKTDEFDSYLMPVYKIQLDTDDMQINRKPDNTPIDPTITEALARYDAEASPACKWINLYTAEQRLIWLMDETRIKAEYARRALEAERIGVKSLPGLKANFEAAQTPGEYRSAFSALMDDLHWSYQKRRLDRIERQKTLSMMNTVGYCLLAFLIGSLFFPPLLEKFWGVKESIWNTYHIMIVIFCGLAGAFLSRMIALQGVLAVIDYDTVKQEFTFGNLGSRAVTGVLGAVILYYMIVSDLVGGQLFPAKNTHAELSEAKTWLPLHPTVDFAKMVIWSIIAGFSERLIPDQLNRIAGDINKREKDLLKPSEG